MKLNKTTLGSHPLNEVMFEVIAVLLPKLQDIFRY